MIAFAASTTLPLRPTLPRHTTPPHPPPHLFPRRVARPLATSVPPTPTRPISIPLPSLRFSQTPLSIARRLQRLSIAIPAMYLPAIALLFTRVFSLSFWRPFPLPLPDKLLCIALLIISPQFMTAASHNLRACAQVAKRAVTKREPIRISNTHPSAASMPDKPPHNSPHTPERLARPVRVHSVLTSVTAAGTLSGLLCALVRPTSGAHIVLLFQIMFYVARRVRFESMARVYRCDSKQYTDIVWACVFATACVLAMRIHIMPAVMAACNLFVACAFWVLKWIFVPRSQPDF